MTRTQRKTISTYRKTANAYWETPTNALANDLDQAEDALMREFLGTVERVHNQRYIALRAALIAAGEII